eukprot:jgi/Chlat1/2150/Chrsp17S02849
MDLRLTPYRLSLCALAGLYSPPPPPPPELNAGGDEDEDEDQELPAGPSTRNDFGGSSSSNNALPVRTQNRLGLFLLKEVDATRVPPEATEPSLSLLSLRLRACLLRSPQGDRDENEVEEDKEYADGVVGAMSEMLAGLECPDDVHTFFERMRGKCACADVNLLSNRLVTACVHGCVHVRVRVFRVLFMHALHSAQHTLMHTQKHACVSVCVLCRTHMFNSDVSQCYPYSIRTETVSRGGSNGGVDPSSVLGLFLRTCLLSFDKLPFEAVCRLLSDVSNYRLDRSSLDPTSFTTSSTFTPSSFRSAPRMRGQLHAHIQAEIAHASQRQSSATHAKSASDTLEQLPLPNGHYLAYVRHLRARDLPAALDSLHRYFDCTGGVGSAFGVGVDGREGGQSSSMGRFQSAALSLGATHFGFGHTQALSETVRVAQQNGDEACLAHVLAHLCHLLLLQHESSGGNSSSSTTITHPLADIIDDSANNDDTTTRLLSLLKQCAHRADGLQLPHLAAFARLTLARFHVHHGVHDADDEHACEGGVLRHVRELLRGCSEAADNGSALGDDAMARLAGSAHLLASAAWNLYGSADMERLHALLHAACYSDTASAEDAGLACAQLALHAAEHDGPAAGLHVLHAASKRHAVTPTQPLPKALLAAELIIRHDWALNRGDLCAADALDAKLKAVAGDEAALCFEAAMRRADTLSAQGCCEEAYEVLVREYECASVRGRRGDLARCMLRLGDALLAAGDPGGALPHAVACASLAHRDALARDTLAAEARVLLAQLWLAISDRNAPAALTMLREVLPVLLANGTLRQRARVHGAIARCMLAFKSMNGQYEEIVEHLMEAAECYDALDAHAGASEAHHFLALVHNALGSHTKRDIAAKQFMRHVLLLKQGNTDDAAAAC